MMSQGNIIYSLVTSSSQRSTEDFQAKAEVFLGHNGSLLSSSFSKVSILYVISLIILLMLGGKEVLGSEPTEKVAYSPPSPVASVKPTLIPELYESTTRVPYQLRIILGRPSFLGPFTWQLKRVWPGTTESASPKRELAVSFMGPLCGKCQAGRFCINFWTRPSHSVLVEH